MTKIIAVSGRKFSGKSTLCNFIQAHLAKKEYDETMCGRPAAQGGFPMPEVHLVPRDDGSITWFSRPYGKKAPYAFAEASEEEVGYLGLHLDANNPVAKVYNFADALKNLCIDLLGIKHEQVWGTEEQKNSATQFMWENLPEYIRWSFGGKKVQIWSSDPSLGDKSTPTPRMLFDTLEGKPLQMIHDLLDTPEHATDQRCYSMALAFGWNPYSLKYGAMTAREVMQVMGTDIMRKMFYNDVWITSTLRTIEKEKPAYALIADMRFKGEFKKIHEAGGYVIRLERAVHKDAHPSEVDLDGYPWHEYPRTLVIPADYDMARKNLAAIDWLEKNVFNGTNE